MDIDHSIFSKEVSSATKLIKDELLRKSLSHDGLARTKLFTWEEMARETVKLFEEVVERDEN